MGWVTAAGHTNNKTVIQDGGVGWGIAFYGRRLGFKGRLLDSYFEACNWSQNRTA